MSHPSSEPSRLTRKQRQVLDTLARGNPGGEDLDMDQLLELIPYETSKQSMQFTVRYLARRGMLVKKEPELRRGRRRVVFALTREGWEAVRDDSSGGGVIVEGDPLDNIL